MRENLIKLLKEILLKSGKPSFEDIADAILADDWIKLPNKLGCEVWVLGQPCGGCPEYNEPVTEESIEKCRQCNKWEIGTCKFDYELIEDWGKLVFATEDEAKERLKELMEDEKIL